MTGTNADESGHSSREQKPDGGLDTWTRTHDLALILIALAYGTDRRLVETELEAIIDAIAGWRPGKNRDEAMEIVMETVTKAVPITHVVKKNMKDPRVPMILKMMSTGINFV